MSSLVRMETDIESFQAFCAPVIGMEVSHIWRGYGSALFLEMGALRPRIRRDGSQGNPTGEMGIMIEWSWRTENENRIIAGSWSDERDWPQLFERLKGSRVRTISLFGRLPEIQVDFSDGLYLCSFMTADGDPEWAIFDRRSGDTKSISIRSGKLLLEHVAQPSNREVSA